MEFASSGSLSGSSTEPPALTMARVMAARAVAVGAETGAAVRRPSASAPGTINIPLPELGSRLGEIPKSGAVVLCCASGTRSGMAKLMLKKNGYRTVYNIGAWSKFLGSSTVGG